MPERVIIVGAGHAAAQLAPSLRKQGWEGEIVIIGDESYIPYQRPPLSKEFMSGEKDEEDILIRPEAAYEKHGIELRLNHAVVAINSVDSALVLDNGERLAYDKLALCTGARARKINLPGSELDGVCYLRTLDDVKNIKHYLDVTASHDVWRSAAPSPRAVIVGGGYIGLETAAVLINMGVNVTVLEMQERVLARVTALEVSEFYQRVHAEEGVSILTNMVVSHIEGGHQDSDKYPLKVCCDNGEYFDADLVIVGVGVIPNVELAEAAGLAVENGITVDEFAFTSDTNIVAVGDCANHPNGLLGRRLRLESVPNAVEQAKSAAASLCGLKLPYISYPWFWSDQYDLKLQIAGLNQGFDQVIIRGDREGSRSFVAWYLKQGQLLAADCINRPKEFLVAKQLLSREITVDPVKLVDDSIDPKIFLQ